MAEQDIDFFDYVDENKLPPLLNKHLYMSDKHENYKKQLSFDKRLGKLMGVDSAEEIQTSRGEFDMLMVKENKKIRNFSITSKT